MKTLWISLNLLGLALIITGVIYSQYNSTGLFIALAGVISFVISNFIKARIFRNR